MSPFLVVLPTCLGSENQCIRCNVYFSITVGAMPIFKMISPVSRSEAILN